jgi:hypothetical protein
MQEENGKGPRPPQDPIQPKVTCMRHLRKIVVCLTSDMTRNYLVHQLQFHVVSIVILWQNKHPLPGWESTTPSCFQFHVTQGTATPPLWPLEAQLLYHRPRLKGHVYPRVDRPRLHPSEKSYDYDI